jgi:ankyrin repeat protein
VKRKNLFSLFFPSSFIHFFLLYNRNTPLHLAIQSGSWDCVELLLSRGCDWMKEDREGRASLHIAAFYGHGNVVEGLIRYGVPPGLVNSKNETALFEAIRKGDEDISLLLLKLGVPIDTRDALGRTALHIAVLSEEVNMVAIVLQAKDGAALLNAQDLRGKTALHYAVASKNQLVCGYLLASGASRTIKDQQGQTPVEGCDNSIKHLLD